jgi:hypothetical protein
VGSLAEPAPMNGAIRLPFGAVAMAGSA